MKRFAILALLTVSACASLWAAKAPKWYKKAKNAICSITVYDAQGNELRHGTGVLLPGGTGLADYELFDGAVRAITVDGTGAEREIRLVLGADRMYSTLRFSVDTDKKYPSVQTAEMPAFTGDVLYLLEYSTDKAYTPRTVTVSRCQNIGEKYRYYTISGNQGTGLEGCALLDADGSLVALMQTGNEKDTCSYALDAGYSSALAVTKATDLNDGSYTALSMPKALPASPDQALVYAIMKRSDSEQYPKILEQFISQFPDNADGYMNRGSYYISTGDSTVHQSAMADLEKAISLSDPADENLFEYGNLIYTTITGNVNVKADGWTLEKALELADKAIAIKEQAEYLKLKGAILFAMQRYDESAQTYVHLNSVKASPESYYFTSVAMQQTGTESDTIIAYLDSAVNFYGKPYTAAIAPYIIERASQKEAAGRYREAVLDYNEYESILGSTTLNAQFYFYREQAELRARMYEPALRDIEKACDLAPDDASLKLELASVLLRVNLTDRSTPILEQLVQDYPDDADCQRLLGVSLMRQGNTESARQHLEKAISLGDTVARQFLENWSKSE